MEREVVVLGGWGVAYPSPQPSPSRGPSRGEGEESPHAPKRGQSRIATGGVEAVCGLGRGAASVKGRDSPNPNDTPCTVRRCGWTAWGRGRGVPIAARGWPGQGPAMTRGIAATTRGIARP